MTKKNPEPMSLRELALALVAAARHENLSRVRVSCLDGSIVDVIVRTDASLVPVAGVAAVYVAEAKPPRSAG